MFDSRDTWLLRPEDDKDGDERLYDIYDKNPELFTLKIHYGGTFHLAPLREYNGGQVRIIDQISTDYFNLADMDVIALGAGYRYKSMVIYLWRIPEATLDNGLRPMQCDSDVAEFLLHASSFKFMEVYMDATPMRNITMLTSITPTTVVIAEIEDGKDLEDVQLQNAEIGNAGADGIAGFDGIAGDEGNAGDDDSMDVQDDVMGVEDHHTEEDESSGEDYIGEEDDEIIGDDVEDEEFEFIDDPKEGDDEGFGNVVDVDAPGTPQIDEPTRDSQEILAMLTNKQGGQDDERVDPMLNQSLDDMSLGDICGGWGQTNKEQPIYTTKEIMEDLLHSSEGEDEDATQLQISK